MGRAEEDRDSGPAGQLGGYEADWIRLQGMPERQEVSALHVKKLVAMAAVVVWLVLLGLLSGPVRWELRHSYEHRIGASEADLPAPTRTFSLPVLGIGPRGPSELLVQLGFWAVAWLPPVVSLSLVWRATSSRGLLEVLVLGGAGYVALLSLLVTLVVLGLWLPFALV